MCLFGGGSSAPTRDLEAEAAQEAERERQEAEKTKAKTKATESKVRRGTPLVQYVQAPKPEAGPDLTTERLGKGDTLVQTERKKRTRLMGRGRARGRRSLLTSTGMGYYGGTL
tara:strand:- start:582 stop:920 length:339 start_codon:yes stop_codon:yes gene_type:complete